MRCYFSVIVSTVPCILHDVFPALCSTFISAGFSWNPFELTLLLLYPPHPSRDKKGVEHVTTYNVPDTQGCALTRKNNNRCINESMVSETKCKHRRAPSWTDSTYKSDERFTAVIENVRRKNWESSARYDMWTYVHVRSVFAPLLTCI